MSVVPPRILAKLRAICRALPDAYEEDAWIGTRWMVKKKNFAHVLEIRDGHPPSYARAASSDGPLVVLTFRVPDIAYASFADDGGRFFQCIWGTRWQTKVVGVRLDRRTDWKEIAMLVGESHRLLAPPPRASRARSAAKRRH